MKHYLLTEGTSWKNITEAFSALNVSRGEFRKNVDNALDESRVAKLDEVIGRGNEFEYVPDSDICVVCGKDCSKKILKFNGISYCSQACLKKLPVKVASLMNRLGIDEYTLLYALISVFSGDRICEFLEIEYGDLKKWIERLSGIKVKEITDKAPLITELKMDKIRKVTNKNHKNSMVFNDDPVFEKVDCFLAM